MTVVGKRRVIVTGGRKYVDYAEVEHQLSLYDPATTIIIHGAAPGADRTADAVARQMGFDVESYPADWSGPCVMQCASGHRRKRPDGTTFCPAAGVYRNQRMLEKGADLVHGFPGNRGTIDMLTRAQEADIPIVTIGWEPFPQLDQLGDYKW